MIDDGDISVYYHSAVKQLHVGTCDTITLDMVDITLLILLEQQFKEKRRTHQYSYRLCLYMWNMARTLAHKPIIHYSFAPGRDW
jgi:hypothetical protein